jgi:hypothetical protein
MTWKEYVGSLLAGVLIFALAVLFFLGLAVLFASLLENGWI